MTYFTWLHLSDLHYWPGRTGWDAFKVLTMLRRDLKFMEQRYGLAPDLMFFTGDIAFGTVPGSQPDNKIEVQFEQSRAFFENVRNAFTQPIDAANTFFVPGNHDVERGLVGKAQTIFLDSAATLETVIASIQSKDIDWQSYMRRLSHYETFLRNGGYEHLLTDPDRLIYVATRKIAGRSLGIAGFNSAWSCCRNGEKSQLWLAGDWQLSTLKSQMHDNDINFALIHHPSNWFREEEDPRIGRDLEREFEFVLHGHEHQGWVQQNADNGHVRIAAAACYENSAKENGYNFGRINMETGECDIWLRRFDREGGGWIPRIIHGKTDNDGRWKLKINPITSILDVSLAENGMVSQEVSALSTPLVAPMLVTSTQLDQLAAAVAERLDISSTVATPNISTPNGDQAEIATQSQITVVKELLDRGRAIEARLVLTKLRADMWDKVSAVMRAKIANNQGAADVSLEDFDLARRHFAEALAYHPNNVKVLSNLAQVAWLQEQIEEALSWSEKALAVDPLCDTAAITFLQALDATGQSARLEAMLAEPSNHWMGVNPLCITAMAAIAYQHNEYARCEQLIRGVIEMNAEDLLHPQCHILLATSLVASVEEALFNERRDQSDLMPTERARIEEAEEAYGKAIEATSGFDNLNQCRRALVSRSGVRIMLGRVDEALRDCDRVLDGDPVDPLALENKGRTLLKMGRYEEAVSTLEALRSVVLAPSTAKIARTLDRSTDDQWRHEVSILLASAYTHAGQPEKVLALLGPLPPRDTNAEESNEDQTVAFSSAELLLYAASELTSPEAKQTEQATLTFLREIRSSDPSAKAILSQYHEKRGENETAIAYLQEAIELAPQVSKNRYRQSLARLFYQLGRYTDAIAPFREVIGTADYHPSMPAFTVSLYNAGHYTEALDIARRVRAAVGIVAGVAEIEADVLQRGGDLEAALDVLEQLISAFPKQYRYVVRAALLKVRVGLADEAKIMVEQLAYGSVSSDPELLLNLAQLRQVLGLPEVLRYGYRARHLAFSNAEVHARYMMLCLNMDQDGEEFTESLRERDIVSIGDAVDLIHEGRLITLIIDDEEPLYPERGEVTSTSTRALRVIGRAKGEHIILRESMLGPEEYEIVEIKSKYLHASYETTRMFEEGTLDHPSMQVLHAEEGTFVERFWKALENLNQNQQEVTDLYFKSPLPLAAYARLINRSLLDVWFGMTVWERGRIFAFVGTNEDKKEQQELLSSNGEKPIVLDLVALLTIVHLELENPIRSRFPHILLSRSVMDNLTELEQKTDKKWRPRGTAASINGLRYFVESPEEKIRSERIFVEKLLQFARSLEVTATLTLLDAERIHRNTLGSPALSSILLAKEQGALLYCDDLHLRRLAKQLWEVNSVETQAVLADLQEQSHILPDVQHESLARLADARYFFVSMTADGLISLLEQHMFQTGGVVRSAFATFEGPDAMEEPAIEIMADVIKRVWLRKLMSYQKSLVLDTALRALVKNRRSTEVLNKLLGSLRGNMRLVEHLYREIQIEINLWSQMNNQ